MNKLALGTVQFGLDYGIKNARGRIPESEVADILRTASASGIDTLDTAAAYGDSESVIGRTLESSSRFRVVTKYPAGENARGAREELAASLGRLGRKSVYGYLLHSFASWEQRPSTLEELFDCREAGLTEKIGISLYRPEEVDRLLDSGAVIDLVQVPYSLLDRRFERVFGRLRDEGVEVHVRSVFLQGLLLMPVETLHPRFASIKDGLGAMHGLAQELGVSAAALCLGFAASNPCVSKTVIGVDSLRDLNENVRAYADGERVGLALQNLPDISSSDESIILPYNWK